MQTRRETLVAQSRLKQDILFFRQLHTMCGSGVALLPALEHIEKGVREPQFSLILKECHGALVRGSSLSQALSKQANNFDPLTIRLIQVGENTGALIQTLEQIALLGEKKLERRQQLGAALAYPICLLLVMIGVCCLFVVFVAPGDAGMSKLLGDDLPWPSLVLVRVSEALKNPVFLGSGLLLLTVLGLALRRAYLRGQEFKLQVDGVLRQIPVLGRLETGLDSARLLDVVSTCLHVGLDIVSSLRSGAEMCRNSCNREDVYEAIAEVKNGESVAGALKSRTQLPPLALSLIDVGEVTGKLQEMSHRTSRMIAEDVNYQIDLALELLEPLLLSIGGMVAGFVAIAALLPVMRLVANFS